MNIIHTHNMANAPPHYLAIPGGIDTRKTITVCGIPTGDSFKINLQTDVPDSGCDVALCFNPRNIKTGSVGRNTCKNGSWQADEINTELQPFRVGKPFVVQFVCTISEFQISVGGRFFCNYKHRMDMKMIHAVWGTGDADFTSMQIEDKLGFAPKYVPIPGGMDIKKAVTVRGVSTGDWYVINLQTKAEKAGSVIPLQFNIRASAVHRNTLNNGWGDVEKDAEFYPFEVGKPFAVQFYCTESYFQISVDGRFFCQYKHRMDPKEIHAVGLEDANFTEVQIEDQLRYVPIPEGLDSGKMITLRGIQNETSWAMNLQGQAHDSNIALHFNPRTNIVVRNTRNPHWQTEENDGEFPFEAGRPFVLQIYCGKSELKIFVDGRFFCDYKHRMAQTLIHAIALPLEGCYFNDVQIEDKLPEK